MDTNFQKNLSYGGFLKYITPSILSMIALSFYTSIDGFFVSRFVGSTPLAAINIVIPFCCIVYGISLMLASGAGAYVSMKLGEGKKEEASAMFSQIVYLLCVIAVIVTIVSIIFLDPILRQLGSTDLLMPYTRSYGGLTVLMTLPMMLKLFLEYFARVDGNPKLAFVMSSTGLVLNVIFDFVFIVPMKMGIFGAALGTLLSILISTLIGVAYFLSPKAVLHFGKPVRDLKLFFYSCINGSSQFFTEISTGVITYLFNIKILAYEGELGISAVTILMFLYYFYLSFYMGLASGACPLISYHFGAEDKEESRRIIRYSVGTLLWLSVAVFGISYIFTHPINSIFSSDADLLEIADYGNRLFSSCYLFAGVNVFMAALLTALGHGKPAATISTLRCLIFPAVAMLALPLAIGEIGIWIGIPIAEFFTLFVSAYYLRKLKNSGILS